MIYGYSEAADSPFFIDLEIRFVVYFRFFSCLYKDSLLLIFSEECRSLSKERLSRDCRLMVVWYMSDCSSGLPVESIL